MTSYALMEGVIITPARAAGRDGPPPIIPSGGSPYAQETRTALRRPSVHRGPDPRVRSAAVAGIGAAGGVPILDLRVHDARVGAARLRGRARQGRARPRRERRIDLCAAESSARRAP